MLSMSPGALNSGAAERYFEEHYSQDDYYTQGQTCIGQWIGKGAATPVRVVNLSITFPFSSP